MNLAILSIATNRYFEYWANLINSARSKIDNFENIKFYLFTDQVLQAKKFLENEEITNVCITSIPGYGWPEATLFRYKIFAEHLDLFEEEVLIYLDADMLIIQDFTWQIPLYLENNEIALVSHPGYWRPIEMRQKITLFFHNPLLFCGDLFRKIKLGGLGSWETRKVSKAFVPRKKRLNYVCGGIWFGYKNSFLQLCIDLKMTVEADLSKGIIAKWHDESHLNAWAALNEFKLVDPSLCYAENYPQLFGLQEYVRAVEK